jgi:hypothetical protein
VALASIAPAAQAAEVSVAPRCAHPDEWCDDPIAHYVATPGEANTLRVEHSFQSFAFYDRVPVTAGHGCTPRADGAVVCAAYVATVDLGDGDDLALADVEQVGALDLTGGPGVDVLSGGGGLRGGPGDDVLVGFALSGDDGDDVLTGTRAIDRLEGGSGADVLSGGAGDDRLSGDGYRASAAPDVIDGGEGNDVADYQYHLVPVHVDLAAPDGGGGEDALAGIEHLVGGRGDDTLLGDAGPNRIGGGRGRNTLAGRGGDDSVGGSGVVLGGAGDDHLHGGRRNDRLIGGRGADRIAGNWGRDEYSGGPGDDLFELSSPRLPNETVHCGGGRDIVVWMGLALLMPDCERAVEVPAHPRVGPAGRLTFTIPAVVSPGRGRLELWRLGASRRFAVARFDARGRTIPVTLTVPRRLRGARVEVRLRVRDHRPQWPPLRQRWVIDLPR